MKKMNLFSLKAILGAMAAMLIVIAGIIASYKTAPPADLAIGAVSGDEVQGDEFTIGGATLFSHKLGLNKSTTTVCAIKSPDKPAKLLVAGVNVTTSTTSVSTWTFARAATAYATTSSLGTFDLVASGTGAHFATTTSNAVFAANSWLVVGVQGGANNYTSNAGGAAYSPVGSCVATWQKL